VGLIKEKKANENESKGVAGGREGLSPGDRDSLARRLVACVGRCLFLSPVLFILRVGGLAIQCPLERCLSIRSF
jgi:hypothetical protein